MMVTGRWIVGKLYRLARRGLASSTGSSRARQCEAIRHPIGLHGLFTSCPTELTAVSCNIGDEAHMHVSIRVASRDWEVEHTFM